MRMTVDFVHKTSKDLRLLQIISHYCPGHAGSCKEVAIFDRTGKSTLDPDLNQIIVTRHPVWNILTPIKLFPFGINILHVKNIFEQHPRHNYQIWPINCYTVYRRWFAVCLVLEFHRPITRLIFLLSYPLYVLNLLVISCNRHYFRKIYSMLIRIQEVRSFLHLSCFSMIRELVKGGNVFLP